MKQPTIRATIVTCALLLSLLAACDGKDGNPDPIGPAASSIDSGTAGGDESAASIVKTVCDRIKATEERFQDGWIWKETQADIDDARRAERLDPSIAPNFAGNLEGGTTRNDENVVAVCGPISGLHNHLDPND